MRMLSAELLVCVCVCVSVQTLCFIICLHVQVCVCVCVCVCCTPSSLSSDTSMRARWASMSTRAFRLQGQQNGGSFFFTFITLPSSRISYNTHTHTHTYIISLILSSVTQWIIFGIKPMTVANIFFSFQLSYSTKPNESESAGAHHWLINDLKGCVHKNCVSKSVRKFEGQCKQYCGSNSVPPHTHRKTDTHTQGRIQ